MKIRMQCLKKLGGLLLVAVACQMILVGAIAAQEDDQNRRRPSATAKGVQTKDINLRIVAKTPQMVQTRHINFLVTESTEIVDSKGKAMTLAEMPVPCKATLTYDQDRLNDPYVWRIVYRGKLSGAKTTWSAPIME